MNSKEKMLVATLSFLTILLVIRYLTGLNQEGNLDTQSTLYVHIADSIKTESVKRKLSLDSDKACLKDSTVVLFFKDLSYTYNYKVIDRYFKYSHQPNLDSVVRTITVYSKADSLVQEIKPYLLIHPLYSFYKNDITSRSYITGKRIQKPIKDGYFGEIVIVDMNFDGLEDIAVTTGCGATNGDQYTFFIQNEFHKFTLNPYLSHEVRWFPEQFDFTKMTFTTIVHSSAVDMCHRTFQYDTIERNWKLIKQIYKRY